MTLPLKEPFKCRLSPARPLQLRVCAVCIPHIFRACQSATICQVQRLSQLGIRITQRPTVLSNQRTLARVCPFTRLQDGQPRLLKHAARSCLAPKLTNHCMQAHGLGRVHGISCVFVPAGMALFLRRPALACHLTEVRHIEEGMVRRNEFRVVEAPFVDCRLDDLRLVAHILLLLLHCIVVLAVAPLDLTVAAIVRFEERGFGLDGRGRWALPCGSIVLVLGGGGSGRLEDGTRARRRRRRGGGVRSRGGAARAFGMLGPGNDDEVVVIVVIVVGWFRPVPLGRVRLRPEGGECGLARRWHRRVRVPVVLLCVRCASVGRVSGPLILPSTRSFTAEWRQRSRCKCTKGRKHAHGGMCGARAGSAAHRLVGAASSVPVVDRLEAQERLEARVRGLQHGARARLQLPKNVRRDLLRGSAGAARVASSAKQEKRRVGDCAALRGLHFEAGGARTARAAVKRG